MNQLDQTVDQYLRAIGAGCPRLLFGLQESPEVVWGELMRMESACYAFMELCSGLEDKAAAAGELMALVEALRVQMAKDGLSDFAEFAAFRQGVSAVQRCADRLRQAFGGGRIELIKDISAPIHVRGRHWGGLRMGAKIS